MNIYIYIYIQTVPQYKYTYVYMHMLPIYMIHDVNRMLPKYVNILGKTDSVLMSYLNFSYNIHRIIHDVFSFISGPR